MKPASIRLSSPEKLLPSNLMDDLTTVAVHRSTLARLRSFREYGRESYDEILNKPAVQL